ncbi:MAG: homoserine dehydrogenase [Candidatus Methanomethylophilus sp.]|nr:homoserine dehydrogenase [Methanomethylophilus sp.]MDD3232861.1 homoserine dehydrogenase [Methanomethylophilus sp.]MDD4221598.1 homoserine dehydrogenase [Methanomethylophilus sp.]MDD4668828.1 homoserine dehydrogenase [Methanomethylophilus sp.]
MMVNAELYVKDLPGQLVGSLEPISMVDGNIVGVVHDREQIINQRIRVSVTFEVASTPQLEKLKAIWKSKDIVISKMGSVYETVTMEYLILGHFSAGYVDNLIDEASNVVNFESVDVSYSSRNGNDTRRTALITAEVRSQTDQDKLDRFFSSACREGSLVYIRGL